MTALPRREVMSSGTPIGGDGLRSSGSGLSFLNYPGADAKANANRDAARECLQQARAKQAAGDEAGALRFAEKSFKLFESEEASTLIKSIKDFGKGSAAEQLTSKVLAAKSHYEVLDVAEDASSDVIKKAYRKLSLKVHPDHNRSKNAEAAFKRLNEAHAVLSDEQQRRTYDRRNDAAGPDGGGSSSRDPFNNVDHEKLMMALLFAALAEEYATGDGPGLPPGRPSGWTKFFQKIMPPETFWMERPDLKLYTGHALYQCCKGDDSLTSKANALRALQVGLSYPSYVLDIDALWGSKVSLSNGR